MKRITGTLIILLSLSALLLNSCTKTESVASNSLAAGGGSTGTTGSLSRFTIVGNYLYAVDLNRLNIFNIASPANTAKTGTVDIGFNIETIYPYGDKLFIGSNTALYVYSLANPANPQMVGIANHFTACDPVVANDTVAYVTVRSGTNCNSTLNQLIVYRLNSAINPIEVWQIPMTSPGGLGYTGNALYVCDVQNLRVYDITNGYFPVAKPPVTGTGKFYDVIPYGNLLICYIENGVSFYDITNRFSPVFLSKITN